MGKIYALLVFMLFSFLGISQVEGIWRIAPEPFAMAVGPAQGDFQYWHFKDEDIAERGCFLDDEFVFYEDGRFKNRQNGDTWLEEWQGVTDATCAAPVAPHDGSGTATWTYNATNRTITLEGVGAHIGLPKAINGSEISDPNSAPSSITYPVVINGDRMTIDINSGVFWHFVLERVGSTTSVYDIVDDQFSFYPNPATDMIRISSDGPLDIFTIRDITGKVVLERNKMIINETIDVTNFNPGLYLLESRSEDKISVKKMMIK